MKQGKCLYCGNGFSYFRSQKVGKFCSKQCCGDFRVESRMTSNSIYDKSIRKWCYRHIEQKCYECGFFGLWNNKPLRFQVNHKDGNTHNNQRNNLGMICPNCHTQTENWGVKNASNEGRIRMIIGAENMRKSKRRGGSLNG